MQQNNKVSNALVALRENSCTELDLIGQEIGDRDASTIAEALRHNSSLSSLNLRDNNIGDEGALRIAEALHHNSSLSSLDLL